MSNWTHNMCWPCWKKLNPGRKPTKAKDTDIETCCFCGNATKAGIYVREDPKKMDCKHDN